MKKILLFLLVGLTLSASAQKQKYNPASGELDFAPPMGISNGDQGEIQFTTGIVLGDAGTVNISTNTDNLVVPDLETLIVLRINVTGNNDLTGIVPPDNTKAWMIFVANVGTGNLILKNNDAGSTAENRFLINANKTIQSNEGILLFYDPVSMRWRGAGVLI